MTIASSGEGEEVRRPIGATTAVGGDKRELTKEVKPLDHHQQEKVNWKQLHPAHAKLQEDDHKVHAVHRHISEPGDG